MSFSKILKELRMDRKLTHQKLAENIGYSKAIIGFWENGKKTPTLGALIELADFFNVSIDYLAGKESEAGVRINNIKDSFNRDNEPIDSNN